MNALDAASRRTSVQPVLLGHVRLRVSQINASNRIGATARPWPLS
jgi:hypothetical protein